MKRIKQLGKIAFLALALSFASCSSDSEGGSTIAGAGTITANVGGTTVTTMEAATIGLLTGTTGFKILSLSGSDLGGDGFTITISGYDNEGTYTIDGVNDQSATFTFLDFDFNNPQNTDNVWSAPYDAQGTSGTVTVTSQTNERVKGTFSFKGINNAGTFKQVTNGSFDVKMNQF
ncbi:hypothetical protein FLAN108750_04955 [Flavobacterium antarcticum]|uniref:hypothetical protein n=1 Tax=Flavobacterium antarcticum TaxID=271155 RepID=UPI0003B5FB19|nr:hypothetical protein [Flavobacterium antarcticum]